MKSSRGQQIVNWYLSFVVFSVITFFSCCMVRHNMWCNIFSYSRTYIKQSVCSRQWFLHKIIHIITPWNLAHFLQNIYNQLTAISLAEPDDGNTAVSKTLVFDTCLIELLHQEKFIIVHISVCISYRHCICCTRPREADSVTNKLKTSLLVHLYTISNILYTISKYF